MIINLINYFCRDLYCIVLLLCYAQYLILETVSFDICLFCIVLRRSFCLCVVCFFLTNFMSDYRMTEFVDLGSDVCV